MNTFVFVCVCVFLFFINSERDEGGRKGGRRARVKGAGKMLSRDYSRPYTVVVFYSYILQCVCVVGVSFLQRRDNNKGLELLKWEGKKQVRDVEREREMRAQVNIYSRAKDEEGEDVEKEVTRRVFLVFFQQDKRGPLQQQQSGTSHSFSFFFFVCP